MICPNCGTQNAFGETICMGCKETLPQIDPKALKENEKVEKNVKKDSNERESKKVKAPKNRLKSKKLLKGVIGGLILIIVVVAGIIVYRYKTKNLNANDPVVRLETVFNDFSLNPIDYVKYILPEAIAKDATTAINALEDADNQHELIKTFKNIADGAYNSWKDKYGDDLTISFDILYKEKISEEKLNEIESFYATAFSKYVLSDNISHDNLAAKIEEENKVSSKNAGKAATALHNIQQYCNTIQLTAGYDLVVRVSFSGRQGSGDILLDVYVVKVDGTWSIDINSTVQKYLSNPDLTDAVKIK